MQAPRVGVAGSEIPNQFARWRRLPDYRDHGLITPIIVTRPSGLVLPRNPPPGKITAHDQGAHLYDLQVSCGGIVALQSRAQTPIDMMFHKGEV